MNNPYDIKSNLPEPDSNSIARRKNFDALLKQFEEQKDQPLESEPTSLTYSVSSNWKKVLYAASISLLLGIGIWSWKATQTTETASEVAFTRPIPTAMPSTYSYTVNANVGDTIIHSESGSKIYIPASAFMHKDGRPVQGNVNINYREYDNPAEMFLAGVTNRSKTESLGMMEIQAFQSNEPIYLAPQKEVSVELVFESNRSEIDKKSIEVFYFDTLKNDWQYNAPDHVELLVNNNKKHHQQNGNNEQSKQHLPMPAKPRQPKLLNKDLYNFQFEVSKEEFPEIAGLGDVIWEVAAETPFKDEWYDIEWNDVQLIKSGEKYEATLTCKNPALTVKSLVTPVVSEKDYNTSIAEWKAEMKHYEELIAIRKETDSKNIVKDSIGLTAGLASSKVTVINHFNINHFGIWNCEKPLPKDSKTEEFALSLPTKTTKGYIVFENANAVYAFDSKSPLTIPASFENTRFVVWEVAENQRISIAQCDGFEKTPQGKNNHKLIFNNPPVAVVNEKQLREQLKMADGCKVTM